MVDRRKTLDITAGTGLLGTLAGICIENLAPTYWPDTWEVNWTAILVGIVAFWAGGSLISWINRRHWLQAWLAKRRQQVLFTPLTVERHADGSMSLLVEAVIAKRIPNATVRLDILTLRHAMGQTQWNESIGDWLRVRRTVVFSHKDLNVGDAFHLPVLLAAPAPKAGEPPRNDHGVHVEGFYRACLAITSATASPIHFNLDFFVIGGNEEFNGSVITLPFSAPPAAYIGEAIDFKEVPYERKPTPIRPALGSDGEGRSP